jgi:hypothetical protein
VEYGVMPETAVLSVLPGGAEQPVKEILQAVAAWCLRLLTKLPLPQPFNNLEAISLNLGFDAMATVLCRSEVFAQDLELSQATSHGRESGVEILLTHKLHSADIRQGNGVAGSWLLDLLAADICQKKQKFIMTLNQTFSNKS